MKFRYIIATFLILITLKPQAAKAFTPDSTHWLAVKTTPYHKFYFSNMADVALFQSSKFSRPGRSGSASTLRFSYFFNFGFNVHYDLNTELGFFSGMGIKNIGFIDKYKGGDSTVKRRVYAVGIPLGIKFGDMQDKKYLFAGGGIDIPFNYKEKAFVSRGHKQKISEWLSDRTPAFMPYVFAGVSLKPQLTLKLQYYLNNFMNPAYVYDNGGLLKYNPYAGFNVHLFMLSVGYEIKYKKLGRKMWDKGNKIKNVM